jgi:PAS domain S-box-containing protein
VSSSPAVLYLLKPEGDRFVVTWISENLERVLGFTPAEALAPGWWRSRLHPDEAGRVLSDIATIFTSGHVTHEYRFRNRQGEYRWLHAELRLLRDREGNPVEAVGSWADVSARKEAELKLEQSEEQYRLLFDNNPHP